MNHRRISNPLLSQPYRAWFVGALAAIVIATGVGNAAAQPTSTLGFEAVSNRADLISSGDILVRVTLPPNVSANQAVLMLNGQPLANPLHPAPDGRGYLALVTGMNLGQNALLLAAGGGALQLDITNHLTGGPVFSGLQLQPWICTTQNHGLGAAVDAECNAAPQYTFVYKNAATANFLAYDPANPPPPAQIASTTTDQGVTVPYIVRRDRRSQPIDLQDTVLFDPAQPWTPWAPQPAWNGKVLQMFGAGAGTQYTQGTWPRVRRQRAGARLRDHGRQPDQSRDDFQHEAQRRNLDDGQGTPCGSLRTDPLHDRSGLFRRRDPAAQRRRPISGPARGMLPKCSYPDIWSLYIASHDCQLFTRYFTALSPGCGPTLRIVWPSSG